MPLARILGTPVLLEDLLIKPEHSLIDQSLHSQLGATTTNGDGFGIGWYGSGDIPGVFQSIEPAWNDRNLRELSARIRSPLVFAHIRASTGAPVQQTNCHPFRHGQWLWMHNGSIAEFAKVKRDLVFAVDPSLIPTIEGSTDSEPFFFLALTFGLAGRPAGRGRARRRLHRADRSRHGVEHPMQMTVATTDGKRVWAFRYSIEGSRGRCSTAHASTRCGSSIRTTVFQMLSDESGSSSPSRSATSRARGTRCPSRHYGVIQEGQDELQPFTPIAP